MGEMRKFCTRPDRHWGLNNHIYNAKIISFSKVKYSGRDVKQSLQSSGEIKESV